MINEPPDTTTTSSQLDERLNELMPPIESRRKASSYRTKLVLFTIGGLIMFATIVAAYLSTRAMTDAHTNTTNVQSRSESLVPGKLDGVSYLYPSSWEGTTKGETAIHVQKIHEIESTPFPMIMATSIPLGAPVSDATITQVRKDVLAKDAEPFFAAFKRLCKSTPAITKTPSLRQIKNTTDLMTATYSCALHDSNQLNATARILVTPRGKGVSIIVATDNTSRSDYAKSNMSNILESVSED